MPELAKVAVSSVPAAVLALLVYFLNQRFGRDQKSIDEAREDRNSLQDRCDHLQKVADDLDTKLAEAQLDALQSAEVAAYHRIVWREQKLKLMAYAKVLRDQVQVLGGNPYAEPSLDVVGTGMTPPPRRPKKITVVRDDD